MIVVSCCNTNGPGIFTINEENEVRAVYEVKTKGIDSLNNHYYALVNNGTRLVKLNKEFQEVQSRPFFNNGHGVHCHKGLIYCTHTYDSEIIAFDESLNYIKHYDFKKQYQLDEFHQNDMVIDNDHMYLTMFGINGKGSNGLDENGNGLGVVTKRKLDDHTNSLGEIVVKNLTQPHSPKIFQGEIYCCNSRESQVMKNQKAIMENLPGFTRGLLIEDETMWIGISGSACRTNPAAFAKFSGAVAKITKIESLIIKIPSNEVYAIIKGI